MGDMASTDVAKAVALIEISTSYSDFAEMLGKSKSTETNGTVCEETRSRKKTVNHG